MSREYPCVYFDDGKCLKHSEVGYTDWCVLGPCTDETPSNGDSIRAMSDEELARFLAGLVLANKALSLKAEEHEFYLRKFTYEFLGWLRSRRCTKEEEELLMQKACGSPIPIGKIKEILEGE